MISVSQPSPATAARWSDLADELDLWGAEGRTATLWWRDDDAATPCGRLERLLKIAGNVPVAFAVIPAEAGFGLAAAIGAGPEGSPETPAPTVLQHGWRHANYADDPKKSEYPATRSEAAVAAELGAGRARLVRLFGTRALAVLAPPWNRIDAQLLPMLGDCGIAGLSRLGPRRAAWPAPGLFEANVHVDLVAWKEGRGFIGVEAALAGLVGHLRARRSGAVDRDEPTGILTHHLVQDEATGAFLHQMIAQTARHPAACWLSGNAVFAAAVTLRATDAGASGVPR